MTDKHDSDVIVAGAGPVGLFASLSLANRGAEVKLFDEAWREGGRSYALALHPATLRLLAEEGVGGEALSQARRIDRVAFYDGPERKLEVSLAGLPTMFPFVAVLPQHDLECLLADALHARQRSVAWNHRVARFRETDGGLEIDVQRLEKVSSGYAVATTEWVVDRETRETARFLIGADGHRSTVRQHLQIDHEQAGEPAYYAVFEFEGDGGPDEVRVVLGEATTDVLWPLPDNRWRWSIQLPPGSRGPEWREKSRLAVQLGAQAFQHLGEQLLRDLLSQRAPWFNAHVTDIRWSVLVRFERRVAERFGEGRVWLAGDAAHLAGPVGVHSMNVGIQEAHDLAVRMSGNLRGLGGRELLEDWGRERVETWRHLLHMDAESGPVSDDWLVRNRTRIRACLPASGAELDQLMAGIDAGLAVTNAR